MDEETSIFFKKYKQILKFKSQATKIGKKNLRYNSKTNDTKSNNINNDNDDEKSLNILPILPNINQMRNSVSSQNQIKDYLKKSDGKKIKGVKKSGQKISKKKI